MKRVTKRKISKKMGSALEQFSGTSVGALVEDFDSKLSVVAEDVLGLHKKVDNISDDIETVKSNVDIIKMDMEFIKHDLRKKVSYDDFAALEKRVAIIENKI